MSTRKTKRSAFEIRRIAVAAQVDPRTVEKYFAGGDVRPMPRSRIVAALATYKAAP